MATRTKYKHKRGDTLSLAGYLPVGALPEGTWSAACVLRPASGDGLITLQVTLTAPTEESLGRYHLRLYASASETANWPVGKLTGDVEFTESTAIPEPFKVSSVDFEIDVERDITAAP